MFSLEFQFACKLHLGLLQFLSLLTVLLLEVLNLLLCHLQLGKQLATDTTQFRPWCVTD